MVLILAGNQGLAKIWAGHLERQQNEVFIATSEWDALDYLRENAVAVIVLDLMLESCSALSIADYASYRHPDSKIVFVTRTGFFSDGSLFTHVPNTAAIVREDSSPDDLAEIISYYGRAC